MARSATATSSGIRRRIDAVAATCGPDGPDDLLADLSQRVREIVPFDAAFFGAADPLTGLATSPALVDGIAPEYCAPYWESEVRTDDYLHFADLARGPARVGSLAGATGGRPSRSGRHRAVMAPSGLDDELRVAFAGGGGTWGVAALYRQTGRPRFDEAELRLIAALVPVIAAGLRRRALESPADVAGMPAGPGMILFDESGSVLSMNDAAEEWLRLLRPDPFLSDRGPSGDAAGVGITTEVITVVQRARAAVEAEGAMAVHPELVTTSHRARQGGGEAARVRVRAVNGLWLVVHASCLAGPGAPHGQVAVVIEAAKGSEMAPIIAEAFALTPREQEITQAVARGEATGEIAGRLHLSPHTVRDHLKAIFEKTGVKSRGELVARLFSDHYLPHMTGGVHTDRA
jgi:DNA-binding CsgD family transcriptional regulator